MVFPMHWLIRRLELHDSTGALIASNDNWMTYDHRRDYHQRPSQRYPETAATLQADRRESAIIAELPPGNYTAIVRGVNNTTGVGLVEVYDLD